MFNLPGLSEKEAKEIACKLKSYAINHLIFRILFNKVPAKSQAQLDYLLEENEKNGGISKTLMPPF